MHSYCEKSTLVARNNPPVNSHPEPIVRHMYDKRCSYRSLCEIAIMVNASIYLFIVSNWSLLLVPVTFFTTCG